jgi:hypothetical protein
MRFVTRAPKKVLETMNRLKKMYIRAFWNHPTSENHASVTTVAPPVKIEKITPLMEKDNIEQVRKKKPKGSLIGHRT